MNVNVKLALILIFCVVTTACTTTQTNNAKLNRSLVYKEQIQTVKLNRLNENITIELASSSASTDLNASRKKAFSAVQKNINDININAVLENSLQHNLVGKAFSDDLVIGSAFSSNSYLMPTLTPSIVMSPNYDVINIVLTTSMTQKRVSGDQQQYKAVYSSPQVIDNKTSKSNRLFWIDNPLVLKERLINGLYDVAKQFADDFNGKK